MQSMKSSLLTPLLPNRDEVPRHRRRNVILRPTPLCVGPGAGLGGIPFILWLLWPWIGLAQAHPPALNRPIDDDQRVRDSENDLGHGLLTKSFSGNPTTPSSIPCTRSPFNRNDLGTDPVAELLLRNLLNYAARGLDKPLANLPADFQEQLKTIGYE
jgi:hypothetical protein